MNMRAGGHKKARGRKKREMNAIMAEIVFELLMNLCYTTGAYFCIGILAINDEQKDFSIIYHLRNMLPNMSMNVIRMTLKRLSDKELEIVFQISVRYIIPHLTRAILLLNAPRSDRDYKSIVEATNSCMRDQLKIKEVPTPYHMVELIEVLTDAMLKGKITCTQMPIDIVQGIIQRNHVRYVEYLEDQKYKRQEMGCDVDTDTYRLNKIEMKFWKNVSHLMS